MPRPRRRCSEIGCDELVPCPTHLPANRRQASSTARGYGAAHRAARAKWAPLVQAGRVRCARCSEVIAPGAKWDLDHDDTRAGYLGPSHARCNRAAPGYARGERNRST